MTVLSVLMLSASCIFAADNTSLFSGNELRADAFATYQSSQSWGYGLGLSYYLTKNLGATVWASRQDFDFGKGNVVDNVDTSLLFRVPLTDVIAPYVSVGNRHLFGFGDNVPVAGLGVEYRITKKFGAFAEGTYVFGAWDKLTVPNVKDVGVRLGLKLGF